MDKLNIVINMYYRLQNPKSKITFTNFGASISSWKIRDSKKEFIPIILSQEKEDYYLNCPSYSGTTVGPVANREVVDGKVILHGGSDGYSKKVFAAKFLSANAIKFSLETKELFLDITYVLEDSTLKIEYEVKTKKETKVNLTNHSYFNLSQEETINKHKLKVESTKYLELDSNNCATGKYLTLNKFNELETINDTVLDYGFCFEGKELKRLALLCGGELKLEVLSTLDNLQIYTGDYLYDSLSHFGKRAAIALEAQRYPNAINLKNFPSILVDGYNKDTIIYKVTLED